MLVSYLINLGHCENRFNNALEAVLARTHPTQYILSIKVDDNEFYPTGELTGDGKVSFWSEVDICLKRFDRNEINLKPRAIKGTETEVNDHLCRSNNSWHHSADHSCQKDESRWLPTPPPKSHHKHPKKHHHCY